MVVALPSQTWGMFDCGPLPDSGPSWGPYGIRGLSQDLTRSAQPEFLFFILEKNIEIKNLVQDIVGILLSCGLLMSGTAIGSVVWSRSYMP